MDGYATHLPALAAAATHSGAGDWLELGCGFYSTPVLRAMRAGRKLHVYSTDPDYSRRVSAIHPVTLIQSWDSWVPPTGKRFFSLTLLDNELLVRDRVKLLPELMQYTGVLLMHDWRDGLSGIPAGVHRSVYKDLGPPWTLILAHDGLKIGLINSALHP